MNFYDHCRFRCADWALLSLLSATVLSWAAGDRVLADFEGTHYAGWTAEGQAFGNGPARGTLPHQQTVSGFSGAGLVNTYLGGDGTPAP